MEIAFILVCFAAIYFYERYKKEQAARLDDQHRREYEESVKQVAATIAKSVAADLAAGMTIEESADKHAPIHQTIRDEGILK